jgi:hypothetical protein
MAKGPRLESLLARLLQYGTWLATAVVGLGLTLAMIERPAGAQNPTTLPGMRIVSAGIAGFILLPVFRLIVMLIVFIRLRDHRFIAITAAVLIIILMSCALGMYLPPI